MIGEIPSVACSTASRFAKQIAQARAQFDAKFSATSSYKTTDTPVTVLGVGFFDFVHGQRGVAPNGIEIHPILSLLFP
jgi:hypothetical protein